MKKLFFVLTALVALTLSIHATTVSVYLTNGHSLDGKLIYHDDTLLVVEPDVYRAKPIHFYPAKVRYFVISGIGRFDTVDDRFVPTEKALQKLPSCVNACEGSATVRTNASRKCLASLRIISVY